ncbi:MAG: hypothetical protein ABW252_04685 [Polyangiales bacterium]
MFDTKKGWLVSASLMIVGACAGGESLLESDDAAAAAQEQAPAAPAASKGGSGGASNTPIEYDDPDIKCYRFTAYQSPSDRGKYSVPTTPDLYVGFNIKAPWTGTQYVKSFRSIIDNKAVLHHWLIYRLLNGGAESILDNSTGIHADGELLNGWAPGTDDLWFDADVGMEIPGGTVFQLENHYNNRTGAPVLDASGVELCVTPNRPKHIAAMSWLGTDRINGVAASGTCTPENKEPVHLLLSFPHMHTKGVHMKVDLTRAAGGVESIHDADFNFDYQRTYVYDDLVIQPGDKVTTTCTFDGPARFGKGTSDEMCYFFSVHWPAGQLARNNIFSTFHGANVCID